MLWVTFMKIFRSINKPLKFYKNKFRYWVLAKKTKNITLQLKQTLSKQVDIIPVIVISYNNGVYVENITKQLQSFNITPIIIDNNSSSKNTQDILYDLEHKNLAHVIRSQHNFGHMVGFLKPIYDLLPEVFAYTDPDLQLNKNLPENFLSKLAELTIELPVFKAGFALSLKDHGPIKDTRYYSCHYKPIFYERHLSIEEFESRYWVNRLKHDSLELYASSIDTTFAVYRKSNYIGKFHNAIRVAGNYSAIHLPWFEELDLLAEEDKAKYRDKNISSNWSQ